jgi:hypothetical protein
VSGQGKVSIGTVHTAHSGGRPRAHSERNGIANCLPMRRARTRTGRDRWEVVQFGRQKDRPEHLLALDHPHRPIRARQVSDRRPALKMDFISLSQRCMASLSQKWLRAQCNSKQLRIYFGDKLTIDGDQVASSEVNYTQFAPGLQFSAFDVESNNSTCNTSCCTLQEEQSGRACWSEARLITAAGAY